MELLVVVVAVPLMAVLVTLVVVAETALERSVGRPAPPRTAPTPRTHPGVPGDAPGVVPLATG